MSKLEIIVLGLLNKNKMYGYEIVKFFKDTGFHLWMKIKLPSIYKVLSRLEEKKYIIKQKIIQQDGIPKNEFVITQEGRNKYFNDLKEFVLTKNKINFFEFIFFSLIMEKSVDKSTFIKAIDMQIEQLDEKNYEADKKHLALRKFFPKENYITSSLSENFRLVKKIHLKMLTDMKERALSNKSNDYFISEDKK
jgi:DNA-binding PadR family transcriptional regulator